MRIPGKVVHENYSTWKKGVLSEQENVPDSILQFAYFLFREAGVEPKQVSVRNFEENQDCTTSEAYFIIPEEYSFGSEITAQIQLQVPGYSADLHVRCRDEFTKENIRKVVLKNSPWWRGEDQVVH